MVSQITKSLNNKIFIVDYIITYHLCNTVDQIMNVAYLHQIKNISRRPHFIKKFPYDRIIQGKEG